MKANRRTIIDWTVTRFVVAILGVAIILSGTFLALAVGQLETAAIEQNRIVLNAVVDRAGSFLKQTTSGMRELGTALAELSANDEETLKSIIDGVRIGSINLRSIDVIGPDARIVYSSPYSATTVGNDVSGRDAYQRVVSDGVPAWSRVFYADFLDDVVITFYVPTRRYVLAGNLSLQRLWSSMESIDISDDTQLSVIDSNGAYIYHSDLRNVERRMFAPDRGALMDAAGTGSYVIRRSDQGERFRTHVATIAGTEWLVAVHQSMQSQKEAQFRLIMAALVVTVVTLAIGVAYIHVSARRNLEPFSRLRSIALRVADGEYDVEYPESRFVEITTLSESLRSMVAGIMRREVSLRDARDQSEKANQAKSELLANVSHEFRTSLNGIVGMCSLLSKTQLDSTQSEYLEAQLQAARVLKRLVDDLLEVSRDNIAATSVPADVELHRLIDSFGTLLGDDDREVRFTWINEVPPGTAGRTDAERLGQIVFNLVSNARKYTPEGAITVHWKLLTEPDKRTTLQLVVRDTGIGIAPDERERVFDSFVQVDPTHTKTKRGLGLGLAIVKRATDLLDGSVSISDNTVEGRGSEITVRIPVELIGPPTEDHPEENVVSGGIDEPNASPRILIVEDEAINRMYLATLLEQEGYTVHEYESGVRLLQEEPIPDAEAILMDIGLPQISGVDVAKKLRDGGLSIPIVALTAYSNRNDIDEYREARMNGFVAKPIAEDVLFRVLRSVLSGESWNE